MRITNAMRSMQVVNNINNSYEKLTKYQNQLSTGQKISRPADDPVGVGYVMRYDTEMSRNDQFLENANTGLGMLNTMDSLMQQSSDVLKRAQTLAQQAATGTIPDTIRAQMSLEANQLLQQMISIGNSDYKGNYLFNGEKTDQAPYTANNAANDVTDKGVYQLSVSSSVTVPIGMPGEKIFGTAGAAQNVFKVLGDLVTHLQTPGSQGALLQDMGNIQERADAISTARAEIGARTNRLDLVVNRIQDNTDSLRTLRSKLDDVDMTKVITDMQMQQNVQQAALSTGAKLIQNSLVDFMK